MKTHKQKIVIVILREIALSEDLLSLMIYLRIKKTLFSSGLAVPLLLVLPNLHRERKREELKREIERE